MNVWTLSATCFLLLILPCLWVCLRGEMLERVIGLQLAQVLSVLAIVTLAVGFRRDVYIDSGLVLAVLSLASGLVFIRFLERWL